MTVRVRSPASVESGSVKERGRYQAPSFFLPSTVDALPPLRYNGSVKWIRRIIIGVVALVALLFISSVVVVSWPASSGSRIEIDDPSPSPNCISTQSADGSFLDCP